MNNCRIYAKARNTASVVRKAAGIWPFPIALLIISMSCTGKKEDLVLAQVGDKKIIVKQLEEFSDEVPLHFQSTKTGIEKQRNDLQTVIDMELLMMEARAKGIDKSLRFLRKMHKSRTQKLLSIFQQRELALDIKEEDLRDLFEKSEYSRAIRFSDIMVDSEDKARAALEEIKQGKSFEEVARRRSVNEETAPRGGDSGLYHTKVRLIPILQDKLFSLKVGEVSEPIKIGRRYSIFKATADSTVQPSSEIYQALYNKKLTLERAALVEKLKIKYRLELDQEGLKSCLARLRGGLSLPTEHDRSIVVYRYDDGKITSEDFIYVIRDLQAIRERHGKGGLPILEDSKQLASFAERFIVPDKMISEAALRAGIDKEEDTARWLENEGRKFVISELREQALEGKISITEDEIRQYYDSHPDKYLLPERIDIQEILVETEEEALSLMEQIQKGAPLGELARAHSTRPADHRDEEGRFHFHPFESQKYGGIVGAAKKAQIGELSGPVHVKGTYPTVGGPVQVAGGYSIFKVLSRRRERQPFEDAKRRVRGQIRRTKEREIFEQFLEGLRKKYASQVHIREDNLKIAFRTK